METDPVAHAKQANRRATPASLRAVAEALVGSGCSDVAVDAIIAVFHGHHHETTNTTFANTPHLSPGSPKHRDVFLVCDVTGEAMRVRAVEYRTDKKGLTYNTAWETKINLAPKATPTP